MWKSPFLHVTEQAEKIYAYGHFFLINAQNFWIFTFLQPIFSCIFRITSEKFLLNSFRTHAASILVTVLVRDKLAFTQAPTES